MKIVVIGGSGLIGTKVVDGLRERGHEVVAASPRSGVNTLTGEGLAAAVANAQVVVDVTNSPTLDAAAMEFFTASTRNLLAAEADAGVTHHVALSIVGIEDLPGSGYLQAKVAQEKLIEDSPIPYSIVRSTQFFEFIGRMADDATEGDTIRVATALIQPLAADDIARAVCDVAAEPPLNGTVQVAGPEPFPIDGLIRQVLRTRNDPRQVIGDPHATYFGTELAERSLVPNRGNVRLAETRLEDWLSRTPAST